MLTHYVVQGLDAVLPLALFIAHERSKGKGSFWQPYLGLLPDNPGCAWLMGPDELQHALQTAKEQLGETFCALTTHSTPSWLHLTQSCRYTAISSS